jgi:RNA polymerase sigma-70 factor (ECF subfamily)
LCRLYWPPVYAYLRRRGYSPTDAEDLTQSFFAHLLERSVVGKADPHRGRFRSFLLTCLRHHLIDQHRQRQARQWRRDAVPVVGAQIEPSLVANGVEAMDPESVFARQWGLTLLAEVLDSLRQQMAQEGQEEWFERLRPHLCGNDGTVPYRQLAEQLGTTEGALRMRVHRLRERYGVRLRETIAQTVSAPEEVDAEIRYLMEVLA